MPLNEPLSFLLPEDAARKIGQRAKERRLAGNLTRETLAERSGVPVSTIKHFETTGKISLVSMLQLADALNCMNSLPEQLFPRQAVTKLDEFSSPLRQRGRR